MKYLLDTHAVLWFNELNPALSPKALTMIKDKEQECWVSYASILELSIKLSLGKIRLELPLSEFVEKKLVDCDFKLLQIELPHLNRLASLPWHHKDPFDRLLVAQAAEENLTIISGDKMLAQYPVQILW